MLKPDDDDIEADMEADIKADMKASPPAAFRYAWQKNMPENRTMVFRQTSAAAQVAKPAYCVIYKS